MRGYEDELSEVIYDCSGWDSEASAIREAFDRGISFQKLKKDIEDEAEKVRVKIRYKFGVYIR